MAALLQFLGMALATAVLYAFGTAWYCIQAEVSLEKALAACVFPFIPFDLIKMAAALHRKAHKTQQQVHQSGHQPPAPPQQAGGEVEGQGPPGDGDGADGDGDGGPLPGSYRSGPSGGWETEGTKRAWPWPPSFAVMGSPPIVN